MAKLRTIVVGVDFSEAGRSALSCAIGLAKALEAEIHLVHGLHIPPEVRLTSDWREQLRERAHQGIREAIARVESEHVACDFSLSEDHPVPAILSLAEKVGADLIVIGAQGHSALEHVLLGSVAERTVRQARCPVLTVPPPGEARSRASN